MTIFILFLLRSSLRRLRDHQVDGQSSGGPGGNRDGSWIQIRADLRPEKKPRIISTAVFGRVATESQARKRPYCTFARPAATSAGIAATSAILAPTSVFARFFRNAPSSLASFLPVSPRRAR